MSSACPAFMQTRETSLICSFSCRQAGKSLPSPIALIKTASTTARAPGVPTVIGNNRTSASLRWTPPEDDGGTPVLGYEAELQPKSRAAIEGGMDDEWMLVYQARPLLHIPDPLGAS
jgi:hypothetical protein